VPTFLLIPRKEDIPASDLADAAALEQIILLLNVAFRKLMQIFLRQILIS